MNQKLKLLAKDLTKEFPRRPRETPAGYVLAARMGVRTAKPEEQMFSACSGSINPVRQRMGRTVEVMTSPGWTIHVARLGASSPGTTWLVAAPSAARSPISMW